MVLVTTCPVRNKHLANIRRIAPDLDIRVFPSLAEAEQDLPDAEIMMTYGEDLTSEIIENCTNLKWIQVISAGLELMPFDAIQKRGLLVTNARGIHIMPMAEHALGVILMFSRRLLEMYQNQVQSKWDRTVRIEELGDRTLGVIGAGAIGSEIAHRAKAFGMHTLGVATTKREQAHFDEVFDRTGLDEVLRQSDYVVVVTPLTPQTEGLIGAREIALLKPTAVLINIGRGQVVDEAALLAALQEQKIRGAALDVFVEEPLPVDHPFWGLDNCIVTPHVSARSPHYMGRAQEIFQYNLQVYVNGAGEMINVIDPARGY